MLAEIWETELNIIICLYSYNYNNSLILNFDPRQTKFSNIPLRFYGSPFLLRPTSIAIKSGTLLMPPRVFRNNILCQINVISASFIKLKLIYLYLSYTSVIAVNLSHHLISYYLLLEHLSLLCFIYCVGL